MSKQPTTAELRQRIEISRVGSEVKQCAIEVCNRLEAAESFIHRVAELVAAQNGTQTLWSEDAQLKYVQGEFRRLHEMISEETFFNWTDQRYQLLKQEQVMKLLTPEQINEIIKYTTKTVTTYTDLGIATPNNLERIGQLLGHIAALEAARVERECEWKLTNDYYCAVWDSSCGESWSFTEGGIDENNVRYCQGCGGKVKLAPLKQGQKP